MGDKNKIEKQRIQKRKAESSSPHRLSRILKKKIIINITIQIPNTPRSAWFGYPFFFYSAILYFLPLFLSGSVPEIFNFFLLRFRLSWVLLNLNFKVYFFSCSISTKSSHTIIILNPLDLESNKCYKNLEIKRDFHSPSNPLVMALIQVITL